MGAVYLFGPFELDEAKFELRRAGAQVRVEPKVLELVLLLVRTRDRVVTKKEILDTLWADVSVGEASVRRVIVQARRALEDDDAQPKIATVRGRGFRFVARVTETSASARVSASLPAASGPSYVGREASLAAIGMRLREAAQSRGSVVWLSGEAGIGKTRTLEEIGRLAAGVGGLVLGSHAAPDAPVFWLWREVLGIHAREEAAGAAGPLPVEVTAVLRGEGLPEGASRFSVFESILGIFVEASRARTLVFLFDDLHSADDPSLRLLELFARNAHKHRWLVVGTYRDGALSADERARTIGRLLGSTGSLAIPLRRFTLEEVARLVEMRTGASPSTPVATAVLERSGGNPFYAEQLLKTEWAERALEAEDAVPSTIDLQRGILEIIGRHLEGVSEAARDLMTVAAILGKEFRVAELGLVGGLGPEDLLDRLDECVRANLLLSSSEATYRFTHVLVRDVLRKRLPSAVRAALHLTVGEKLFAHYGAAMDARVGELADHFLRALPKGDPERAVELGSRAAEHEAKLGRHGKAVKWWRRTLRAYGFLPPEDARRVHAQLGLAHALIAAGEPIDAREAFLEAAVLGQTYARGHALAEASLGFVSVARDDGPQARALLEQSLTALASVSDEEGRRLRKLVERALSDRGP